MQSIIAHIPHDSTLIPQEVSFLISPKELTAERIKMTDAFTAELFAHPLVCPCLAEVSRLVVDVERFDDDEQEPMSRVGMGVIYTATADGRPLKFPPSSEERRRLLDAYYYPHHARLRHMVETSLAHYGKAFILDGHSFPARALPYECLANPNICRNRPEVCVGYSDYHLPKPIVDFALRFFRAAGLATAANEPFPGALVPTPYCNREPRVRSLMIEIRRDLYMDEATGAKNANFSSVQKLIGDFIDALVVELSVN